MFLHANKEVRVTFMQAVVGWMIEVSFNVSLACGLFYVGVKMLCWALPLVKAAWMLNRG